MSKTMPRRRERGYLAKVEKELFGIYRQSKALSGRGADVTPADMQDVMEGALRALESLGWRREAPKTAPRDTARPNA